MLSCLYLLALVTTVAGATTEIFILAGQSNMAGRGGVNNGHWDGVIPPQISPDHRILRLNADGAWEKAHEPLHADIDARKTCGVGPGMAFANEILRSRGGGDDVAAVGLVPCAIGGTSIAKWARGTRLYEDLVGRASEASRLISGGIVRAVLWFQGESDTVKLSDAEAYKRNMERLIMDLRSDLNLPNLLFIQVALASGEGRYIEEVRRAQFGIDLPNVKCVDAMGLGLKSDHLHLTTLSQVHLGQMLAHAFLSS